MGWSGSAGQAGTAGQVGDASLMGWGRGGRVRAPAARGRPRPAQDGMPAALMSCTVYGYAENSPLLGACCDASLAVMNALNAATLLATGVTAAPPTTNCSSASNTGPTTFTKSPM